MPVGGYKKQDLTPITFDANGSVTNDGTNTFTYDAKGRLTGAQTALGAVTYKVNALGQRYSKTVSGTTTIFLYDKDGRLLAESSDAGVNWIGYVWLNDTPVAGLKTALPTPDRFYVHPDHLNTPRILTDQNQQIRWRWNNDDPFGGNMANENPSGLGPISLYLRYPGQYFDKETNLHYNYFRDYDPGIGRYVQSDPIGLQGGINTYAYVGNSPIASADPSGLACVSVGGRTTCSVPGGPTFTVPTPLGFPAMLAPNDDFYHFYRVQRSLGCATPNSVLGGLINNPTPGVPLPATPQGTPNNAVVLGVNNYVTSYLTVDVTSGAAIVVNIAGAGGGAAFGPGYVARYVSSGQAITAGEGTNWKQSPAVTGSALQNAANDALWGQQMNRIIQQCGCQR